MTVLLPAIVPVGLIILIGFIAGTDAGEPNAFWPFIYCHRFYRQPVQDNTLSARGFSYRIRDYLFAALPGGVGDG